MGRKEPHAVEPMNVPPRKSEPYNGREDVDVSVSSVAQPSPSESDNGVRPVVESLDDVPTPAASRPSPVASNLDPIDLPTRSLRAPDSGVHAAVADPNGSKDSANASKDSEAPRDRRLGEVLIGKYRLDRLVGKGGMGRVYLGVQFPLNRQVAVKILNPEFQKKDPQFVRRFFLEAATAARLNHQNTITVFDYGETERGELFIAMEYLSGRPLSRVLSADGPFNAERTVHVAIQIARALREAHSKGIIHRDLKPGNIMLMEEGDDADFVKVLDFGLVKLFNPGSPGEAHPLGPITPNNGEDAEAQGEITRAGMFLGSPKYMSPEQIQGGDLDPRTDIYSLGVIMFQMLAGRPPFRGSTSVEIIYKHVNTPVPPIHEVYPGTEVPPELELVVQRCLSKHREGRFASMADLVAALKDVKRLITGASSISGGAFGLDLAHMRANSDSVVPAHLPPLVNNSHPPIPVTVPSNRPRTSSSPQVRHSSIPGVPAAPSRAVSAPEASFLDHAVVTDDDSGSKASGPRRRAPPPSRALPIAGGVALVLALGAVAFFVSAPKRQAPPAAGGEAIAGAGGPLPSGAVPPSDKIAKAPAAPVPAPEARVGFSSKPQGAEVFEGTDFLGVTPFELTVPRAAEPTTRTFVFKKGGFRDEIVHEKLDSDRMKIVASLRAVEEEAAPAPAPVEPPPKAEPPRRAAAPSPVRRAAPTPARESQKAEQPREGAKSSSDYKENPY
jgi:serine/threonine-protein kinase